MVSDGRLGAPQTSPCALRLPEVLVRRQPLLQARSPWPDVCLLGAAKGDELISRTQEVALTPSCQLLLELGSGSQAGHRAGTRPAFHWANLLTHLPLLLNKPGSWHAGSSPEESDGRGRRPPGGDQGRAGGVGESNCSLRELSPTCHPVPPSADCTGDKNMCLPEDFRAPSTSRNKHITERNVARGEICFA